jgi:hypothetical protein
MVENLNLILAVGLKCTVLVWMSILLFRKWWQQERRFFSDFPILMGMGFLLFASVKIVDLYLYISLSDIFSQYNESNANYLPWAQFRYFLGILSVLPVTLLMLAIWFGNRKKIQWLLGGIWASISLISIFFATNLDEFLQITAIYAFPPILLIAITFFIIHRQKRLPQINSLVLGLGWSGYIFLQIIRPLWYQLGAGTFGLAWLGELIEMSAMVVIGMGFFIPAFYIKKTEKNRTPKNNAQIKKL